MAASYVKYRLPYCEICGGNQFVTCHHIDPESYGTEQRHDIVSLCRDCHNELHRMVKKGWLNFVSAHFEMWMHGNREYTNTQSVLNMPSRYARKYSDIAKHFKISREKVRTKLRENNLVAGNPENISNLARSHNYYVQDEGWDLDLLAPLFNKL